MAIKPLRKVLIANRGEIAVRVMRTCREMGLFTVAVFSDADRAAQHVRMADEAYNIGRPPSPESYLRIDAILDVARRSGADAIHPGYGFLAENAAFADACRDAGVVFVGPPAEAMRAMGEKTSARRRMIQAGVPVVPGTSEPIAQAQEALKAAKALGFPVILKAAAGGGGKGMHQVDGEADFFHLLASAEREAQSAFGDGRVYLEKYLTKPRHIEVQIFADSHGNCIHLGERECSVQRRHQKVVEESPSALVTPAMREQMGQMAVKAALAVNYLGAGTVECMVDADRHFYFLEMNTRLQVEHPVTELCTGLDLVRWQLLVAQGDPLPLKQSEVEHRGHAVEARVYAEDPAHDFMPAPGRVEYLRQPGGPGVRNDSGLYAGFTVPVFYDPLISKLVAWHDTRAAAIDRLQRALGEYVIKGISTNIAYLKRVLELPEFRSGDYDTSLLPRNHAKLVAPAGHSTDEIALMAAAIHQSRRDEARARQLATNSTGGRRESTWKLLGRAAALRKGEG